MGDGAQACKAPSTEPAQPRGGSSHQAQVAISSSHCAWVGRTTEQTHSCFGEGTYESSREGMGAEGLPELWPGRMDKVLAGQMIEGVDAGV